MSQIIFEKFLEKKENELREIKKLKSFALKLSNIEQSVFKLEKGYSINESILNNLIDLVTYFNSVKNLISSNIKEFEGCFLTEVPLTKLQILDNSDNLKCFKLFDTYFVLKTFTPRKTRKSGKYSNGAETRLISVIQVSGDFKVELGGHNLIVTTNDLEFFINASSESNFLYSIRKDGDTYSFLTSEYYLKRNFLKKSKSGINEFEIKSVPLIYNKYDEEKVSCIETKMYDLIYRFVNVNDLKFLLNSSKYNLMFWSLSLPIYENKSIEFDKEERLKINSNYSDGKGFLEKRSIESYHFNNYALFHAGDISDIEAFVTELKK